MHRLPTGCIIVSQLNWHNYLQQFVTKLYVFLDTGYTERYMGLNTEEDNAKGYHESNVNLAEKAKNFLGKKLLLNACNWRS